MAWFTGYARRFVVGAAHNVLMTPHATDTGPNDIPSVPAELSGDTPSAVIAYDSERRDGARDDGLPVMRTATPGVVPFPAPTASQSSNGRNNEHPTVFIWIDPDSEKPFYRMLGHEEVSPLSSGSLYEFMNAKQFTRMVFPDRATLYRIHRKTEKAAQSRIAAHRENALRARSVSRQLDVLSRLTYSAFCVVLTKALSRKYWLPSHLDETSLYAWAQACDAGSVARDGMSAVMENLLGVASEGDSAEEFTRQMYFAERDAIYSSRFGGLPASSNAFHSVERVETAAAAWDMRDILLIDRNVLDGTVCALTTKDVDDAGMSAMGMVSEPFRLKTNKPLIGFTRSRKFDKIKLTMDAVEAREDGLYARFKAGNVRRTAHVENTLRILNRACDENRLLFLAEAPHFAFSAKSERTVTDRWTSNESQPFIRHTASAPVQLLEAAE